MLPCSLSNIIILSCRSLTPRLTLYLTHTQVLENKGNPKAGVFRALYLDSLSCGELSMRLAAHMCLTPDQVSDIYMEGPGGIRVLVTDEVVQHMKNDGLFAVEARQGEKRNL